MTWPTSIVTLSLAFTASASDAAAEEKPRSPTIAAAEGLPLHLAHLQFYGYGKEVDLSDKEAWSCDVDTWSRSRTRRGFLIPAASAASMNSAGRLLIAEMVLPAGDTPHPGKMLDIAMLVWPGGQERTLTEYDHLLSKGGFHLSRVVHTDSAVNIVEAVPA
jgi:O-methyltransferase domain